MTATINYDLPLENFIDELDETEHVTHIAYRKDKVTIHHNGGRLSHAGVLSVWQNRPASAHFNIDAKGTAAQFVRINEYAWATGNTDGNVRSISIEQCNETTAPDWRVGSLTWHGAARLTAWIHANVFGWRPNRDSVVRHHDWSSTACPGPYMDSIWDEFIAACVNYYNQFTAGHGGPTPGLPSPGDSPKSLDQLVDEVIAGEWGNGEDRRNGLSAHGYNYDEVQAAVNARLSGQPSQPSDQDNESVADEVLMGHWGNDPERRQRLIEAGYDADAVQAIVNRRLGTGAPSAGVKPGPRSVATQVILGQWGNGEERRRLLEGAGYNYQEVQDEVNRQLGVS